MIPEQLLRDIFLVDVIEDVLCCYGFSLTIIFRIKVLCNNSVLRLFFYQYPVIKEPSNADGVVHELSLYQIWSGGVYTLSSM